MRVVRFYVSCRLPSFLPSFLPSSLPSFFLVFQCCRTSTTIIHAKCSLPDLNHDHPRQVFPAGPQPRPATPSVPCRTSTTSSHAECSPPEFNRDHPRPVLIYVHGKWPLVPQQVTLWIFCILFQLSSHQHGKSKQFHGTVAQ